MHWHRCCGIAIVAVSLVAGPSLWAASIRGKVFDSESGLNLQGVRISVGTIEKTVYSERGGGFRIKNVPDGTYQVTASFVGYPPMSQTVTITETDAVASLTFDFRADEIVSLEEFTIEGSLMGQAKALNIQRSASNIVDVVASDAFGQFVDRNAAEALQRLPGISVEESQGEGKFIIIRGADPSVNSVAVDGVVAATPEEDGRTTALNIISIDQLESIEVTKSWLPDRSANFIGGAVNLITRSALDRGERFASVEYAYGRYEISNRHSYRFSANFGDVLLKNKNLGIQFSFDFSEDNRGSDTLRMGRWGTDVGIDVRDPFPPNGFQINEFQLEDFIIKRERKGFSNKLEYTLNDNHSFYFSISRNEFDDDETLQETIIDIDLADSAYAGKTVYDIDVVRALGLDPEDPEIAARLALPPDERPVRFQEAVDLGDIAFDESTWTYTRQRFVAEADKRWTSKIVNDTVLTLQGGGEHRLFDRFDLDYKIYKSEADKDWSEQGLGLRTTETSSITGIGEGNVPFFIEQGVKIGDPGFYRFDQFNGFVQDNKFQSFDERIGYEVNLETEYQVLSLNWTTKFGFAVDNREKRFLRFFQGFSDVENSSGFNLITLENGGFGAGNLVGFLPEFGNWDFGPSFDTKDARAFIMDPGEDIEFVETRQNVTSTVSDAVLKNFEATEDITAAYFMQTLDWKGFRIIGGFRYEKTENSFTNNEIDTRPEILPVNNRFASPGFWQAIIANAGPDELFNTVTSRRSYEHWLPAFHVNISFSEKLVLRTSYTQTIARPKFTDLVPREIVSIGGQSGLDFGNSVRLPNFSLRPTESENFDVSLHRYFGRVGLIGVNFFYKNLDGPTYTESRRVSVNEPIAMELNEQYVSNPDTGAHAWETTRQANAGKGELRGLEIIFDRKLDFLPGFWNGFGFTFNATFVDSEVALTLDERLGEKVPLFKQSDRLTNLSVYYEKHGFLARASMLWRGGYLDAVEAGRSRILTEIEGQIGAPANSLDTYLQDFFRLDLRIEYRVPKWGTVFFEGTNLTNQPLHKIDGHPVRLNLIQFTRPIYFVGFKWTL